MNSTSTRTRPALRNTAKLHRHENGTIHALGSDSKTVYTVFLGPQATCTCPAGKNGRTCYHVQTACERYGNATYFRPLKCSIKDDVSDLYN